MPTITSSDGVELYYEDTGQGRPLVLIHGWSFSGRFFHRNVPVLAEQFRVITPDLRGHGRSGKPGHGYRVARLAADMRDLLEALDLQDAVLLGWSLGSPVIWSYLELCGRERVEGAIFVQQSPRQYYAPDWKLGHAKCYDAESAATMLAQLNADPASFDRENLASCMYRQPDDHEQRFLLDEMAASPADARSAIMADHTVQDWRDLLPHLDIPALVMVACQDSVFPWKGPAVVGELMPNASTVLFEQSSHMLFHDEPEKFNASVSEFARQAGSAMN